jgi:hypothetical protein
MVCLVHGADRHAVGGGGIPERVERVEKERDRRLATRPEPPSMACSPGLP